jgi:hypothetical protein
MGVGYVGDELDGPGRIGTLIFGLAGNGGGGCFGGYCRTLTGDFCDAQRSSIVLSKLFEEEDGLVKIDSKPCLVLCLNIVVIRFSQRR